MTDDKLKKANYLQREIKEYKEFLECQKKNFGCELTITLHPCCDSGKSVHVDNKILLENLHEYIFDFITERYEELKKEYDEL